MYYSDINNEELQQFHNTVKITADYEELENYNNIFDTSQENKLIPLFYADKITGNSNLRILENKLVIYMDNDDLDSVYFSSEDQSKDFNILHEFETVNNKDYLKLHFFNKLSLFGLVNYSFNLSYDNVSEDYTTDEYGNAIIPVDTTSGTFTITSNNHTVTWEEN